MMELNLNDEERIEPIDFGGSDKEMANEMEGNVKKDSDDLGGVLGDQGKPITCLLYHPTEQCGVVSLSFVTSFIFVIQICGCFVLVFCYIGVFHKAQLKWITL